MLVRTEAFIGGAGLEEAGEPVPGALPAWNSVGPTYTSSDVSAQHQVSVPAHSAGDLLLLVCAVRNNDLDAALDSIDTDGWTQFGGAGNTYGGNQIAKVGLGWKIGDGEENSVTITTSGGSSADAVKARVHVFTAADGFAETPVQGIASNSASGSTSTSAQMPTVVPSGENELAVCVIDVNGSTSIAAATGETGGDWTEPVAEDTSGSSHSIGIQVSDQSDGSTISGGSAALGGNVTWVTVGFTLVPATVGGGGGSPGPPGPQPFTPADLDDLAVWIDGGLSTPTYHSGNALSQLTDLSGNDNHLVQPTSGAAPSHGTRQINGIDVVDFNGSQWARINAEIGDGGVVHLFAVIVIDENISGRYLFEAGALSDGADGWNVRQSTSSRLQVMVEDETETGRDIRVSNATFTPGVPFFLEAAIQGDTLLKIAINGVATSTTPTNGGMANPDNVLDIFTNSGGSNMTDGALAAFVICTSIQDANKVAQVTSYMQNRWGL